jgi:hypothetical protein
MRRVFMAASVAALVAGLLMDNAQSQTPGGAFASFAGTWSGTSSFGTAIVLQVEPGGKFKIEGKRPGQPIKESDAGMAKLDGTVLIIPFSNNQGQMRLTKKGEALEGNSVLGANTATLTLTRSR